LEKRLRITVPDFLNQSRLLSTGRYGEVFRQMGLGGFLAGARTAASQMFRERSLGFWAGALGILGAGLHAIPAEFEGVILLHGGLMDFALSLRRLDMLEKMLRVMRRRCPRARVGFHSNLAAEALNAMHLIDVPIDEVSLLTSPRALGMEEIFRAMRRVEGRSDVGLTAEVGLAPDIVHSAAFDAPGRWAFGADAVLLGMGADPVWAGQRRARMSRDWKSAFPGLEMPEGVL